MTDSFRGHADSEHPPLFEPGTTIDGKYRVERVIGQGGMGVVFAATHLQLEQRVAIKALLPAALEHPQIVERFAREARVTAKITSQHVARVFDVGTLADGSPYMVMEYLEGKDLKELVKARGPLPIGDACEYLLQACEALAEAHAAGIIHRDLKPANIFVTWRADDVPNVKLLDFGISKFTVHPDDSRLDPSMTSTTLVMGSPGYMSPEQMKSTRDVDQRADIWALGTVLYEVLTGRPAFVADTMPQLCAMILSEFPPLPSSLRADLPIALERAILRCLEKQPEGRFANVGELAQVLADYAPDRAAASLRRIGAALGDASLPVVSVRSSPSRALRATSEAGAPADRERGGRGRGWLALAALLAAGVGVAAWRGPLDWGATRDKIASAMASTTKANDAAQPSAAKVAPAAPSAERSSSASAPIAVLPPPPDASTATPIDASVVEDAAAEIDDSADDAGVDDDAAADDDAASNVTLPADASTVAPAVPRAAPPPRAQPHRRPAKPPPRPRRKGWHK